ncbi:MAG: S8 family peptidase [Candidatus Fermentibacteraceae bacterium]|nr:S8 family peptidase [Candidatus Fermentibacteraceae bacterium]
MRPLCRTFLLSFLVLITSSGNAEGEYPCEKNLIEVMFIDESSVRLREGELVDLSDACALEGLEDVLAITEGYRWFRFSEVPEDEIDSMEAGGEELSGCDVYNLNNIYRLHFQGNVSAWELSERLQDLPGVLRAMPVPLPVPLPIPPDYQSFQGYLNSAGSTPTGIDAYYAWSQGGGDGTGVTVCDLEYSWNYLHNDLSRLPGSQINTWVVDPFSDNNHGTAVVGEMVSDFNSWGTTGICHGAGLKTCGTYYGTPSPQWNVAGAVTLAISNLGAGDVILIEQQWEYVTGSNDYVPIEWWGSYSPNPQQYNSVYVAIQNAVANGIHVVEPGGNAVNGGGANMDLMPWLGDSGAIIVGGGGAYPGGTWPGGDLQRLFYSNYGARITSQGWGEDVVTTGYGTLYNSEGVDYFYASGFSGTSSASPVVAGAVACCVGYWICNGNPAVTLTPSILRNALNVTGTPQVYPPSGNIGSRPDLVGAFAYLYGMGGVGAEGEGSSSGIFVYPNPAGTSVSVDITPCPGGGIQVSGMAVYDIAGRRMASLRPTVSGQESAHYTWDCRDQNGASVPGGIYIVAGYIDGEYAAEQLVVIGR